MHWDQRPGDNVTPRKSRDRLPGRSTLAGPGLRADRRKLSTNFLHATLSAPGGSRTSSWRGELINGDGTNNRLTFVRPSGGRRLQHRRPGAERSSGGPRPAAAPRAAHSGSPRRARLPAEAPRTPPGLAGRPGTRLPTSRASALNTSRPDGRGAPGAEAGRSARHGIPRRKLLGGRVQPPQDGGSRPSDGGGRGAWGAI